MSALLSSSTRFAAAPAAAPAPRAVRAAPRAAQVFRTASSTSRRAARLPSLRVAAASSPSSQQTVK